jgi:hypothetical protein
MRGMMEEEYIVHKEQMKNAQKCNQKPGSGKITCTW